MISRAAVKALIDKTEASYRDCWATLAKLKNPEDAEGPEGAELFRAMLEFQSTLAGALYDLSDMYRRLHQEKRRVVARKANLKPEWYRRRLALVAEYQRAIKVVISIGKHLGDSFAWIFYADERNVQVEHYEHQGQLHAPLNPRVLLSIASSISRPRTRPGTSTPHGLPERSRRPAQILALVHDAIVRGASRPTPVNYIGAPRRAVGLAP